MVNRQAQLIVVLIAVLLAVVAGSGAVLWLLQSRDGGGVRTTIPARTPTPADTTGTAVPRAGFDTAILRSTYYTTLDQQLVTDGSLPVAPPAVSGKANPFL